jgi:hypothetical protein
MHTYMHTCHACSQIHICNLRTNTVDPRRRKSVGYMHIHIYTYTYTYMHEYLHTYTMCAGGTLANAGLYNFIDVNTRSNQEQGQCRSTANLLATLLQKLVYYLYMLIHEHTCMYMYVYIYMYMYMYM